MAKYSQVIFYSFLIGCVEASAQTDTSFTFSLQIIEIEKAKDSQSIHKTWHIKDNKTSYTETSTLRENFKRYFTAELSTKKVEDLQGVIDASLRQDKKKPKKNRFKAPSKITHCIWELTWQGKNFRIELYELSKNITQDRIYQKFQQIVEIVGEW